MANIGEVNKPDAYLVIRGQNSTEKYTGAIRPTRFLAFLKKNGHNPFVFDFNEDGSFGFGRLIEFYKCLALVFKIRRSMVCRIYASGAPFFLFLISIICRPIPKVRVLLEFRDPWTNDEMAERPALKSAIVATVEFTCILCADKVVAVSDAIMKSVCGYGVLKDDKFHVVPTEFSKREIDMLGTRGSKPRRDGPLIVGHFGNVDRLMSVEDAIELIKCNDKALFKFYGTINEDVTGVLDAQKLKNLRVFGRVSIGEVYQLMSECDVLLLLGSKTSQRLHRKVFEYIYLGKPIIYFGSRQNPTYEVLIRSGANVLTDIKEIGADFVSGKSMKAASEVAARYEENIVFERLADIMSSM